MLFSYLFQDSVLEETGFGIYAVIGPKYDLGDMTVIVDLLHQTVYEHGSDTKVPWDKFLAAYLPSLVETI
jgi:hypothetical protein